MENVPSQDFRYHDNDHDNDNDYDNDHEAMELGLGKYLKGYLAPTSHPWLD